MEPMDYARGELTSKPAITTTLEWLPAHSKIEQSRAELHDATPAGQHGEQDSSPALLSAARFGLLISNRDPAAALV